MIDNCANAQVLQVFSSTLSILQMILILQIIDVVTSKLPIKFYLKQ